MAPAQLCYRPVNSHRTEWGAVGLLRDVTSNLDPKGEKEVAEPQWAEANVEREPGALRQQGDPVSISKVRWEASRTGPMGRPHPEAHVGE